MVINQSVPHFHSGLVPLICILFLLASQQGSNKPVIVLQHASSDHGCHNAIPISISKFCKTPYLSRMLGGSIGVFECANTTFETTPRQSCFV